MSDTHAFDSSILSAPTIYGTNSKIDLYIHPIRVHMMSVVLLLLPISSTVRTVVLHTT